MPLRLLDLGGGIDRDAPPIEQFFAAERRPLLVLALGCFVLFFLFNGDRDLWTPDEPRFGQICKEMLEDGHVFVLTVSGRPYSDKPPLYFYLVCVLTFVAGWIRGAAHALPTDWLVRAPSAAAAAAGVFIVYGLGKRLLNRRAAFFGAAAMALSWTYVWQGRTAQLDMLLSALVFASIACWARVGFGGNRPAAWTFWFYVFAALATLTKGPPGFIIPFGTVIVFRCWETNPRRTLWTAAAWCAAVLVLGFLAGNPDASRRAVVSDRTLFLLTGAFVLALVAGGLVAWRDLARQVHWVRHGLGFVLFLAIILAWLVPMNLLSPKDFAEKVLLTQTLARYFGAEHHRGSMLGYYPPRLLVDWLPLTLLAPAALWAAFRGETALPRRQRRFLLSWFLFTYVFFSLSPGKRDQYLLPCWPAIGLLFGHLFDRITAGERIPPKWLWIPNAVLGGAFLVGAVAAFGLHLALVTRAAPVEALDARIRESLGPGGIAAVANVPVGLLAVPLILGGAGLIRAAARRDATAGFMHLGFATLLAWALVAIFIFPGANAVKSFRPFCEAINAKWRPGEAVASYKLGGDLYVFHGNYRLQEVERSDDLERILRGPGPAFAIMRMDDYGRRFKGRVGDVPIYPVAETHAGGRYVVCVSNEPPGSGGRRAAGIVAAP